MIANTLDEVFPREPVPQVLEEEPSIERVCLEERIRQIAGEFGVVSDELDAEEHLEILYHLLRCEQRKREDLQVAYESRLPMTQTALGQVAYDATNMCLDHFWTDADEGIQDDYICEAGAIVSSVFVALCRIPQDKLEEFHDECAGKLRPFLEKAFHEAVETSGPIERVDA